jgi:YceI-like domain.
MRWAIYLFFICVTLQVGVASDAHNLFYEITPESRITIAGRSNMASFRCITAEIPNGSFMAFVTNESDLVSFFNAKIPVRVKSLDCSNRLINNDLYKTLNADNNPTIALNFKEAKLIATYPNDTYKYRIKVDMTLANVQREERGEVMVQKISKSSYRVTGSQLIRLSSYKIKPPSAMFGLIRVEDDMQIEFNVVVKVRSDF